MLNQYQIILGSQSPRRSELLAKMGFEFEIRVSDIDEVYDESINPFDVASFLANLKSEHIQISKNELLITADSVVILNDQILGKPLDKQDAFKTLSLLSGNQHFVDTGVCIRSTNKKIIFHEIATVTFASLSNEEINYYLEKFEPYDKAGSYGIQDWIGMNKVEKIIGNYTNIMGLPTAALYKHLSSF